MCPESLGYCSSVVLFVVVLGRVAVFVRGVRSRAGFLVLVLFGLCAYQLETGQECVTTTREGDVVSGTVKHLNQGYDPRGLCLIVFAVLLLYTTSVNSNIPLCKKTANRSNTSGIYHMRLAPKVTPIPHLKSARTYSRVCDFSCLLFFCVPRPPCWSYKIGWCWLNIYDCIQRRGRSARMATCARIPRCVS